MFQMQEHRLALKPGYQLDHFRIEAVLGKGGFGITYLALDLRLGKKVAIKELLPDSIATRVEGYTVVPQSGAQDESWQWARQRFLEEARVLAGFSHPAIVGVHLLLEAHGTVYMVMDYVEGESYESRLKRIGKEPDQNSLMCVMGPILDGLAEVHAKGLLHRDIKPENILINARGHPVLIDFGSARESVGKTMTMTSIVTHGYSPIEQYQTKGKMGPWTDIYAMGAVMCRAITGEKPPVAADRLMDDDFGWLSYREVAGFSEEFKQAVDWSLRVRPEDRPQSVQHFFAQIRQACITASNLSKTTSLTRSAIVPTALFPSAVPEPVPPTSERISSFKVRESSRLAEKRENDAMRAALVGDCDAYERALRGSGMSRSILDSHGANISFGSASPRLGVPPPVPKSDELTNLMPAQQEQIVQSHPSAGVPKPRKVSAWGSLALFALFMAVVGGFMIFVAGENEDLLRRAQKGDAIAQLRLGLKYAHGMEVTRDDAEAVRWLRKAAEQGEATAQYGLGVMYMNGRGVTKDEKEAIKWYRKSAEQGHIDAQLNLGARCADGSGVAQDDAEAVRWFRKAAEQGNTFAKYNLGIMYWHGRGVARDKKAALRLLREASAEGNEDATKFLKSQ